MKLVIRMIMLLAMTGMLWSCDKEIDDITPQSIDQPAPSGDDPDCKGDCDPDSGSD